MEQQQVYRQKINIEPIITSKETIELIKRFEGLRLHPYIDAAGIPSIGYGSTYYENGTKVRVKDKKISKARAVDLLTKNIKSYEKTVRDSVISDINQNQFDALVSLSYNIGSYAFQKSGLLKLVNNNPQDLNISKRFMLWNKSNHVTLKSLTIRRSLESDLYFKY